MASEKFKQDSDLVESQEETDTSLSPSPKAKVISKIETLPKDSTIGVVFSSFTAEIDDELSVTEREEVVIVGEQIHKEKEFYRVRKVNGQKGGLVPKDCIYILTSTSKNGAEPQFEVVALHKYTSRSSEELSFDEQDAIVVQSTDENITKKRGFWKGKHLKEDKVGIFPSHMVYKRREPKDAQFPFYAKALFDSKLEYSECLQFLQGDYLIILSRHSEGILQGCKVTDEKAIGLIAETAVEFSSKEEATNWLTNGKPSSESSRKIAVDEKEQISSDATASDGRPRPKLRKRVSFEENLRPSEPDAIKMEFPKDPEELEKTAICFQQLLQDKQQKINSLNSQLKKLEEELRLERFVFSFAIIIIGFLGAYLM